MHDHPTALSHYLRTGRNVSTGQKMVTFDALECKLSKLDAIMATIQEPDKLLFRHYFFGHGRTYDLVANGMLQHITKSDALQREKERFIADMKRELLNEGQKLCEQYQKDTSGRVAPRQRLNKRFPDRRPYINFIRDFFSLGGCSVKMVVNMDGEVDCTTETINVAGSMSFEINEGYEDVWDLNNERPGNEELPGGTAFSMVARWSERLDFRERF